MRTGASCLAAAVMISLAAGCATGTTESSGSVEPAVTIIPAPAVEETVVAVEALAPPARPAASHGIRLESLRLSGAGLLVDFRYRVVDAAEAAHIVNRKTQPYIVDQATGHQFGVPHAQKIGTLRHMGGKLEDGRSYSMLFANPGRTIKIGSKVNVVVGHLRLEDLTVE